MRLLKVYICVIIFITSQLVWGATPGELVVEPPTLHCIGFRWGVSGSQETVVSVEYRKKGDDAWREALPLMRVDQAFFAGSIFNLDAGTEYECRLTMSDPAGIEGEAQRTLDIRTRPVPEFPQGGTVWHVYPPDHQGDKAANSLESLYSATSGEEVEKIKPGDTILVHAGTYTLPRRESRDLTGAVHFNADKAPVGELTGKTWHLYPPRTKAKRSENTLRGPLQGILCRMQNRRDEYIEAGDTVLVHAGEYKMDRENYREPLSNTHSWSGGYIVNLTGTKDQPIHFKAAGDGEVIFDGSDNFRLFELSDAKHIWFDGITLRNTDVAFWAQRPGVGACEGLIVTDCKVENVVMDVWEQKEIEEPWHGTYFVRLKGTEEKPIVIRAAGDGEVVIDGGDGSTIFDLCGADHVWLDGLHIRNAETGILAGLRWLEGCDGLMVTNCRITDVRNGIYAIYGDNTKYYIADNHIEGRMDGRGGIGNYEAPFGILAFGRGHVICHNYVEGFHDGVDVGWWHYETDLERNWYASSIDIYRNDVFMMGDNFLETDGGYTNIRVYENRFFNCGAAGLSNQQAGPGPNYWIRNLAVQTFGGEQAFKNIASGVVAYHNTITAHDVWTSRSPSDYRNNIFVGLDQTGKRREGSMMALSVNTDKDYVHDYNANRVRPDAPEKPFEAKAGNKEEAYATLEALAAATGKEQHGIVIPGFEIFRKCLDLDKQEGKYDYKGRKVYRPEDFDMRPKPDSPTVDAGVALPNINDDYTGNAPDLGAYEQGKPIPHYGPRQSGKE